MAAEAGNGPEFNFDLFNEAYYDPQRVADEVAWPMVRALWHGDWQSESDNGDEFVFPKARTIQGIEYTAELYAGCELEEDNGLVRDVKVTLDEFAQGALRSFLIQAARDRRSEVLETMASEQEAEDEFVDDLYGAEWLDHNESGFSVSKVTIYNFETSGDWYAMHYHALGGPETDDFVHLDLDRTADVVTVQGLRATDIEQLHLAGRILGVPTRLLASIEAMTARQSNG